MENRTRLEIPAITFLKIAIAFVLFMAVVRLVPLVLLVALAILLAMALQPAVDWLQQHSLPRWAALTLVTILLVAFLGFIFFVLIPEILSQVTSIAKNLGPLQKEVQTQLPEGWPRNLAHRFLHDPEAVLGDVSEILKKIGLAVIGGTYQVGLLLIVTIYLLIDGGKAFDWFLAYFPRESRAKLRQTAREIEPVIFAYVAGQAITSLIVAVYTFALHTILGVPGALTLAALAAIFDMLPIIGFICSTVSALIMALSVSPSTALIVAAAYLFYQGIENYVIVPRVYGNRLRLSTLAVLLSFLVAGTLAGVPGALLVLPVVASYPIVEKIWLKRYLEPETVDRHQEQLGSQGKSP